MAVAIQTMVGSHVILKIVDDINHSEFSVFPDLGGSLNCLKLNGKSLLLDATSEHEIQKQTIGTFAGAQLFPFPNRLCNGDYTFSGVKYHLPLNDKTFNNSLHGLVYDQKFRVIKTVQSRDFIELSFDCHNIHEGYPFHVHITNKFHLSSSLFEITSIIENLEPITIPCAHGWHPYFTINDKVDELELKINGKETFEINEQLIPTGELLHYSDFIKSEKIGLRYLNHCFRLSDPENKQIAVLYNSVSNETITLEQKGYPYLQVYTPPDRKSIALEPQTCIPDAFNNLVGLMYLKSNEKVELKFSIRVEC